MVNKVLIIGFGSIGQRHYKILKQHKLVKNILILTRQKLRINKILKIEDAIKFDPDLIIISSTTNTHFKYLKFFEENFRNKKILIEKPLFHRYKKINSIKNKIYVGYNLRFDPVIQFLKKKLLNQKIYSVNVINYSYLPNWRKSRKYQNTSSAKKKYGGGVLRDLSHEIDFVQWIFGNMKIKYYNNNKVSNLKIDTDDNLLIHANSKKVKDIVIIMNFFSRIIKRMIYVNSEKFSISADLVNKKVIIKKFNKTIYKIWSRNNHQLNYVKQLKNIIYDKNNKTSTTYEQGLDTLKVIDKINKH